MSASMQPSHTSQGTGGTKGERKEPLLFHIHARSQSPPAATLNIYLIYQQELTRFLLLGFMDVRLKALGCVTNWPQI